MWKVFGAAPQMVIYLDGYQAILTLFPFPNYLKERFITRTLLSIRAYVLEVKGP